MNRLLGGEIQGIKPVTDSGDSNTNAGVPNPVLMFLGKREEPQIKSSKSATRKVRNNDDLRAMHQAGGYNHSEYERRNWSEIYMQI